MDTSRCPRKLMKTPETPCELGREAVNAAKDNKHGGCEFFVNDRESNYCFFKYLELHDEPKDPAEIARLLLIDDSEVKKIVSKCRKLLQAEMSKDDPENDLDD